MSVTLNPFSKIQLYSNDLISHQNINRGLRRLHDDAQSLSAGIDGKAASNHTHTLADLSGNLTQARSHDSADTDVGTSSLHHTLGTGQYQAAAGNHTHTGVDTVQGYITWSGGTPSINGGVGLSSIDDDGVGAGTLHFTSNFSNLTYKLAHAVEDATQSLICTFTGRAVGSISFDINANAGGSVDPDGGLNIRIAP